MEAKEIYLRMKKALERLRRHGEQGTTARIYRLGERWTRITETPFGNVEYKKLPKNAQELLRQEIGQMFPQVGEILYFVPGKDDPLQHRGLIIKLPSKNGRINFEIWEDGTFRIVSEDFHPKHYGIKGKIALEGAEAKDPKIEQILEKHYEALRKEILKLNAGKGLPYNFEVIYGVKKDGGEFSPRQARRGTRVIIQYMNFREPQESIEDILKNLARIRRRVIEFHEKLGARNESS